MKNISLILDGYRGIQEYRIIFMISLSILYPIIIAGNILIIYVISVERCLHKPVYIFICNLSCINLYGGSGMTPFILIKMFNYEDTISWLGCLLQIFSVLTYAGCEITSLMVMAFDRYLAICFPLKYEQMMSTSTVIVCIAFTWLVPFVRVSITLSITGSYEICHFILEKIYCDNYSVVKLACSDISTYKVYSSIIVFLYVVFPFLIIFYSYVRIIVISITLSKSTQDKVMNTCVPHLFAVFNFLFGCSFELYQNKFDMSHVPYPARVCLSLYFLILSPLLNPIVYGIRTEKINMAIRKNIDDIVHKMCFFNIYSGS